MHCSFHNSSFLHPAGPAEEDLTYQLVFLLHDNIHQLDNNRYSNAPSLSYFLNSWTNSKSLKEDFFFCWQSSLLKTEWHRRFSLKVKKAKSSTQNWCRSKRNILRFKFPLYCISWINLVWTSGASSPTSCSKLGPYSSTSMLVTVLCIKPRQCFPDKPTARWHSRQTD